MNQPGTHFHQPVSLPQLSAPVGHEVAAWQPDSGIERSGVCGAEQSKGK
jgi:hypothetical protein